MYSANHALTKHFNYFFNRINPSSNYIQQASSQHRTITNLIKQSPLTEKLKPYCFLQGSYDRQTAIYTINDIDIVVLCNALVYNPNQTHYYARSYSRDEIFEIIASPLKNDGHYRHKVNYGKTSMCIKLDLGIKVEILPVVRHYLFKETQTNIEPFFLYRPENQRWEEGYARYHQEHLSNKNKKAYNNFIPAIKVFKHLNRYHSINAVSFHIECLLFVVPDHVFNGNSATYIMEVLKYISQYTVEDWWKSKIHTPCQERLLFSDTEWRFDEWKKFYDAVVSWSTIAQSAYTAKSKDTAISYWQHLLGNQYFPKEQS